MERDENPVWLAKLRGLEAALDVYLVVLWKLPSLINASQAFFSAPTTLLAAAEYIRINLQKLHPAIRLYWRWWVPEQTIKIQLK